MLYAQFFLGFLIYGCYAFVSYTDQIKTSNWYYPLGLSLALAANAVWMWIAKADTNASSLLTKALIWDVIVTVVTVAFPLFVFGARLTLQQSLGLVLLLVGLVLVKV